MYKCRTGKHWWIYVEDADKCCDPQWERILLVGPKSIRQHLGGVRSVIQMEGTVVGFAWQKKGSA